MNKQDWTYKTFGEIMSPACVERCGERKLPVLSITMRNGIVEQNERFSKSIASNDKSNYKVVKNGQLVIAFPIDEGLLYTQDVVPEGIMSPAYNIWDVDYSCINRRFLVTFFHSSFAFAYYKAKLKGTTQRRRTMDKTDLLSMPIPVPPIAEQERIVAELDLLSGVIEKKKEQLKAYDQLAQSIFYSMFGDPIDNPKRWETKKLKDITTKIGSGATPKGGNQSYKNEGISLIRSLNVHNGSFKYEDLAHIDEQQAHQLNNVIVEENDVLFNITGASVARCCIVPFDVLPARVNQHVSILRPKKEIVNHVYLCYYLISPNSQNALLVMSKSNAATREALPKSMMEKYSICIPPLSLQQEFAEKVEAIERQKALVQQSIVETQTMFDYTMDKYFG